MPNANYTARGDQRSLRRIELKLRGSWQGSSLSLYGRVVLGQLSHFLITAQCIGQLHLPGRSPAAGDERHSRVSPRRESSGTRSRALPVHNALRLRSW